MPFQDNQPEKALDKIFQPFFTTKPTGEGTGLGLILSYDIITKGHGGEIKVKTEKGEGSEFVIYIPQKFNAVFNWVLRQIFVNHETQMNYPII